MKSIILKTTCSHCYEDLECLGCGDFWYKDATVNVWLCKSCVKKIKVPNKRELLESCGWKKPQSGLEITDNSKIKYVEEVFP